MKDLYAKNSQSEVPMRHYLSIYRGLSPEEIESRCKTKFDPVGRAFALTLLGDEYAIGHPGFEIECKKSLLDKPLLPHDASARILVVRYLACGSLLPGTGKMLSYRELPWGEVYLRNFEGRCIRRLAASLKAGELKRAAEKLGARPLDMGDAACRLEFLPGLDIDVILWAADEEFPASAQILFSDNFIFAFTAEDLAAVGDLVIKVLKHLAKK
jgi:hypothetical protein